VTQGNGLRNGNGANGNGGNGRSPWNTGRRRRRDRRRSRAGLTIGLLAVLAVIGATVAIAAFAVTGVAAFRDSCDITSLQQVAIGQNSFVYAADGSFLGVIPAENNRQELAIEEISPWLPKATVAIEDRRFYEHGGVDYEAIVRAAFENWRARDVVQGGSTLTQQLVRNLYRPVGTERTLTRKLKEACLAMKLDAAWSKEQILEAYLNQVYYGNRAYGVEAAAQTYFSKSAANLTLAESALLAGLTQAPSFFDPFRRQAEAVARRNEVLKAMLEAGFITKVEYVDASSVPVDLKLGDLYTKIREPYFFSYVREQLIQEYGASYVQTGGLRIYTTIDLRFQRLASQAIKEVLTESDDPAAAIVAINPQNGAIRAMVSVTPGGQGSQFNLAAQGRRQAGSTFKMFVLTEAIRRGANPDSTYYLSAPFFYQPDENSEPWTPETYDGSYYGPSSLTTSTLRSDNSVFARLTLDVGPNRVGELAKEMGVRSPLTPVPSIGLGTNGVSVLDMASGYATLAAGGVYSEPTAIRRVVLPSGEVDETWSEPRRRRVLPDWVAYEVTRILEENMQSGTGTGAYFGRPAAGKTGTTDDYTDAWFCGYTPTLSTSVWIGYPNAAIQMTSVHGRTVSGGSFPADIWNLFVSRALASTPVADFTLPRQQPEWRPWKGEYQGYGSYVPTDTGDTGTGATETAPTEPVDGGEQPATETEPVLEPVPEPEPIPEPTPEPEPSPVETAPPPEQPTVTIGLG
jgi:penicillin-binding protein 1A